MRIPYRAYRSELIGRPHYVYRAYIGEVLAYVGVTTNPTSRFTKHRSQKAWWRTVTEITLTEYDDRTDAFEAEKRAIADEDPQYNIARPRKETP